MTEGVRLQKYLSQAGVASRRQAEVLIRAGRVRLNGVVVTELGTKVRPGADRVMVDGREVAQARPVWIALHKPRGVVSTRRDPQGRRTVYDLLPPAHRRLFHVGRLDLDSEGLLLLTNEGEAAHRLLHPRYGVERVYEVEVDGRPARATLERLTRGVPLEDGVARAHGVRALRGAPGRGRLRLALREGRKREVRRMLEAVGHPVVRLVRVQYGPVRLGDLPAGAWRPLAAPELAALRADAPPQRRS
jgi:23S rRNA pseudouridine2605 synthase